MKCKFPIKLFVLAYLYCFSKLILRIHIIQCQDYIPGTTQMAAVDSVLRFRQKVLTLLKHNLVVAQARMKQQCDKHRTKRVFQVDNWVYMRLQPNKQQSVAFRASHKLSPRFFGHLRIIQKIGEVAYKLALLAGPTILPVFHVSCLKAKLGLHTVPISTLPFVILRLFFHMNLQLYCRPDLII